MAIPVSDLTQLDPATVQANLAIVVQQIQEDNPTLDLKRGPIHDILAYIHAILATAQQVTLDRYLSARSLQQITLDPTLADDSVVDDVLSNFQVTRQPATAAQGTITIVVTQDTTVSIALGATFIANGQSYATTAAFTAKTEADQIVTATDRLLIPLSGGSFAFTIDVESLLVGSAGMLRKDTLVVPLVSPPNFLKAYATDDFTGGADAQTNAQLIAQLALGISAKTISNRATMSALLLDTPEFSQVVGTSIVGYGDPEMTRDQHSILPVSLGGRVDWYVRSTAQVARTALTKTATLMSIDSDGHGIWQFSVVRDDAPGFYEIANIRLLTSDQVTGGFAITQDSRATDLTGGGFIPDIQTITEGAYSRYQTTTIQFRDTTTDPSSLSLGATQAYAIEARGMPLLADIQTLVSSRDTRSVGADCLVRAPIPCFVQVSLVINKPTNQATPDLVAMAGAIAAAVNAVGFIGRLDASVLQDAIAPFLLPNVITGPMDLLGRIRRPDGTTSWLRDSAVLQITDDAARGVTSKTVQFFSDPENVSIAVRTTIPIPT